MTRRVRRRPLRSSPGLTVLAGAGFVALALSGCRPSALDVACADSIVCGATQFCDFVVDACGHERSRGVCAPRPASCAPDSEVVCGCDRATYPSACLAQAAGSDVAHVGACADRCDADDVHASGTCDLALGWFWDGSACVSLSGCVCDGIDCGLAALGAGECDAAHAACVRGGDAGARADAGP